MAFSSLIFVIIGFVGNNCLYQMGDCIGNDDDNGCEALFEYPRVNHLLIMIGSTMAIVPMIIITLLILLHRTIKGANADIKWTLMIVIGAYTGFILIGGGILSIYIYLYYDYLFGDLYKNINYQGSTEKIGDRWEDNGCTSKLIGGLSLSILTGVLLFIFTGLFAVLGDAKAAEPPQSTVATSTVTPDIYIPPPA